MELFNILSAFGLSASAGLNAYIPLLIVALVAKFTNLFQLTEPWDVLTSWWIIGLLVVLSLIEFFADKVPAVNHINDAIQTFIRPAAGAILFAASAKTITDVSPVLSIAAGLLISGGIHTVKSIAVRPAVSATTMGAGNIPVSILEDLVSTALSLVSVLVPLAIGCILLPLAAWLFWWAFRPRRASRT